MVMVMVMTLVMVLVMTMVMAMAMMKSFLEYDGYVGCNQQLSETQTDRQTDIATSRLNLPRADLVKIFRAEQ